MPSINKDLEAAFELHNAAKDVTKKLYEQPFLSEKPNNNTAVDDALAIMTMSSTSHFIEVRRQVQKKRLENAALMLRALLELRANINYLITAKNQAALAKKFLSTSREIMRNFSAVREGRKPTRISWADISITARVKLLDDNSIATYCLLSSYSHADAGFLATYYHNFRGEFAVFLVGVCAAYMLQIASMLGTVGLLDKNFHAKTLELLKQKFS